MNTNIKRLAVLGSTGSIGQQTLDIVRRFPDKYKIIGLAGGSNLELLIKQIEEFRPQFVYSKKHPELPPNIKLTSMEEMASHPDTDLIILATSGNTGLLPLLSAIRNSKNIALANKESLVMAGEIVMNEVQRYHAKIFPVDSEHSAIWQCLNGETNTIARIILTASGGPFYKYNFTALSDITAEEALKHPTWKMGKKVTIDSATLFNKGLETIEAHWLFSTPYEKIEIIIHPQSIIHSMVEFEDGSIKAQLSYPDMHYPIQYAMSYPQRYDNPDLTHIDFSKLNILTFEPVNYHNFPCLALARKAGELGGTYPAVLCAADEVAVNKFLIGQIKFTDIAEILNEVMCRHYAISNPILEEILSSDAWARNIAEQIIKERNQ